MRVLKSFFIAVSLYSRIPVPSFEWKEEDMRYLFCFFPWIGAGMGGGLYLWDYLCSVYQINNLCRTAVGMALLLLITGGDPCGRVHGYDGRAAFLSGEGEEA